MIDIMTVRDHCESCISCAACSDTRICFALVDAAYELKKLADELDRKAMEDVDKDIIRRADLALKDLFQLMGGV